MVCSEYKVVVLGNGAVGKSALTIKYVSGTFVDRYDPTVEDFYAKEITVDGMSSTLEVLDTAGTNQFAAMHDLYIRNGHGFVLVYSIDNRVSFGEMKSFWEQIHKVKATDKVPIVMVGNKSDLEHNREVSRSEAQKLAKLWNIPFFETCPKHNVNVDAVFETLVQRIESTKKPPRMCNIM